MACKKIPEVVLRGSSCSKAMPVIGMGTAVYPLGQADIRSAVLRAIQLGYRHFDTAAVYLSERPVGEAVAEALRIGALASRDELFITSKLWCADAHADRVLPALQDTLRNLGTEYLDLYLIHWPVTTKAGKYVFPVPEGDHLTFDLSSVWAAMEECQKLGLTRAIGVCNFSCKKLKALLSIAKIPPVVNQVEVNPLWQQKKLREFCVAKGIQVCAYSPLGGKGTSWGADGVMNCQVLQRIAEAKGKSLALVVSSAPLVSPTASVAEGRILEALQYEQGDCVLVKSFKGERMMQNLDIFDWELDEEERQKINMIEQCKGVRALGFISPTGQYKSLEEFWDGEI